MASEEVDRVTKALAEQGILVTALHNHLVHGWPDLYSCISGRRIVPRKWPKGCGPVLMR